MSTDLRQQLRELGEHHRTLRTPVEIEELERTALVQPGRPALKGAWVAAAAMAAVLLLVGGLLIVIPPADPEPVPPAGVTDPAASTPSLSPEEEAAPATAVPEGTALGVVTVIPPQPLPPQTATSLDAGQLAWRNYDFADVPGLGEVVSTVVLGLVEGSHLVVVEEAEGRIEDELLVSEDGVKFSWREDASFLVAGGDATDVIVGADLLWLVPNLPSRSVYRSADGVTWAAVEFSGGPPIVHWKEGDQAILRRAATIVTAHDSSVFTSTDDGYSFVEVAPFGDVDGLLTVGATGEEFFAVATYDEGRVLIASSRDGLDWVVHEQPVDLGVVSDGGAYFGKVSGDDPSLFLVVDVQGPHLFRYSREGDEIRVDEVAALDADLIAELGANPFDAAVLNGISAHHWEGRFVLRREGLRWVLFVSDDGVEWRSVTLGEVLDGGKPSFGNGLIFRGGGYLSIGEIALD